MKRRGTTTIEFALVIVPFLMVLMAIMETGIYFMHAIVLQGAVETASRLVFTGQINSASLNAFKLKLSDNLFGLIPLSDLAIRVNASTTFANSAYATSLFNNNGQPVNQTFNTGTSGQVVLVQVSYRYQFITPGVGALLSPDASGIITSTSTTAFRNELF